MKPEIVKVSVYQMKLLKMVSLFFQYYGNITTMVEQNSDIVSYNYVLSSLLDENLAELLNEESYDLLEKTLSIEKNFSFLKISEKKKKLEEIVQYYYVFNGNICTLLQNIPYSKEEVFRVLQDKLVKSIYGAEVYQTIQTSIAEYQDKEYVIKELQKVQVKSL